MANKIFRIPDPTGETDGDAVMVLPVRFEVCARCEGRGKHVNPAVDGHGISQEEFEQDPDFEENYFAGVYDVTCEECDGLRVIEVVDVSNLTKAQKADFEAYTAHQRQLARWERERRHEMLMGY